ncbi:MAG: response regulator [Spirochaetales bacterium]|nr:response regulator [Spirochaetales bacterium]
MKLLIADDEYLVRFSVSDILKELSFSFDITEAESGKDMINKVKTAPPDIGLIDIHMPGINGLKAIEELENFAPNTKWIILTGFSEFEYSRKALRLGVIDYLLKPVDPKELEESINRAINIISEEKGEDKISIKLQQQNNTAKDMTDLLVRQAKTIAEAHFKESIGVSQIAEKVNITPNYLSSVFKKYAGVSLTTYLTNLRLEESLKLLQKPGITIKEVSAEIGYSSSRHFAHLFKEKYGISPSEYQIGETCNFS